MTRPAISARTIGALALPAMLTNIATALFGLADMWMIGRLGDASAQGAVELGARFMTSLLVIFNFLRTGTTALTAQAAGDRQAAGGERTAEARARDELVATLFRALGLALLITLGLVAARGVIVPLGLGWLDAHGVVGTDAHRYIDLRYWACPAVLINGVLIGWLVGQRRVRAVLACEVAANIRPEKRQDALLANRPDASELSTGGLSDDPLSATSQEQGPCPPKKPPPICCPKSLKNMVSERMQPKRHLLPCALAKADRRSSIIQTSAVSVNGRPVACS